MKRLTIFFMVACLSACSDRSSVPKDILPTDSMRTIMRDIIIADGYSTQIISKDSSRHDKMKASEDLLEAVFKIHHTTRAAFTRSLSFYESRPDLNKMIFDSLAAEANRRKPDLFAPPKSTVKPIPRIAVK